MKSTARLAGAAGLTLIAAMALAHGGATGVVKERMEAMEAMGDVMEALAPMMQGSAPYDAGTVRAGAKKIADHAGKALTSKFPAGTAGAPSEALPAIWQSWDAFTGFSRQLEVFAKGLERAAGNGIGGMPGAGTMMGGGGMMGGAGPFAGGMMGGQTGAISAEHIGQMPADMAFAMVSQTCSSCHARFRAEDD